jgi:nucleotide-binding universal stress UspA family protein
MEGPTAGQVATILVPLDGSQLAEQALPHASALATALGSRIVLARVPETTLVPVVSSGVWVTHEAESSEAQEQAARYLDDIAARDSLRDLVGQKLTPRHPVAPGLLAAIEASGADLVVLATHGRSGIGRWPFGEVADKLVQATATPVYIVRCQAELPPLHSIRCVMVPLDGSELAESALPTAQDLARSTGGRLHLMRVPDLPADRTDLGEGIGWKPELLRRTILEAETYLADRSRAFEAAGIDTTFDTEALEPGGAAAAILTHARRAGADVIVISSHGRSGIDRWLFGTIASRVIRSSELPVWLVRATIDLQVA